MTSFQIDESESTGIANAQSPLESFMYGLRAKETIRQYPKRLKIFFDCGIDCTLTLEEQANLFYKNPLKTTIGHSYISRSLLNTKKNE